MLDRTLPVEFGVDPTSATPALLNIPSVAEYRQMMVQSDPGNRSSKLK